VNFSASLEPKRIVWWKTFSSSETFLTDCTRQQGCQVCLDKTYQNVDNLRQMTTRSNKW
jgi:hypothetical protein